MKFQRVEVEHGFAYKGSDVHAFRRKFTRMLSSFISRQRFITIAIERSVGYSPLLLR